MRFFDSVYLLALATWVGCVFFYSFAVAPTVSRALGSEQGGGLLRILSPRHYSWGAMAGAIALPAFVAVPLCYPEYRGAGVGLQALVILTCILAMLYGANSLTPGINTARDHGTLGHERLQRRSRLLDMFVLAAGIWLLIAFANRPAPRTSGILEPSPRERARFDPSSGQGGAFVPPIAKPRQPRSRQAEAQPTREAGGRGGR
jgi:hypothetical protein